MTKVSRFTKGVWVAGALALSASLAIPAPAHAARRKTGNPALTCYGQPKERIHLTERGPGGWFTSGAIMVTEQSPCRDINLRGSRSDGLPREANYRIVFGGMEAYPSRTTRVGNGWRVVFAGAREGMIFRLQSDTPGSVIVRS